MLLTLGIALFLTGSLLPGADSTAEAEGPTSRPTSKPKPGADGAIDAESVDVAVESALDWLARHQHPTGYWEGANFFPRCEKPASPCAMAENAYVDGRGFPGYDAGQTGLVLLAFVESGYTHKKESPYRDTILKAAKWLLSQQAHRVEKVDRFRIGKTDAEGSIYCHAIATLALARLLEVSRDSDSLRRPVQAAGDWAMRARGKEFGWKYEYEGARSDTSVTVWMIEALETIRRCGEKRLCRISQRQYQRAVDGGLAWLDRATARASARTGYMNPGSPSASLLGVYPEPYPYSKKLPTLTAAALVCRAQLGQTGGELIAGGRRLLSEHPPTWMVPDGKERSTTNFYYWFHGARALAAIGGRDREPWNRALFEALVRHQRGEGCEAGSWDPIGEWGAAGGRVYATALGALALDAARGSSSAQ